MSTPSFSLYYWDIRGRAEVLRLTFALKGASVEVKGIVDMKTDKDLYKFGQAPVLIDNDASLTIWQSNTMIRYVARKFGLEGTTEADKVKVDMTVEAVESMRNPYVEMVYVGCLSEEAQAKFVATYIDKANINGRNGGAHMDYFEKLLTKDGLITGCGITIGDICLWDMLDTVMRVFASEIKATYPALCAFHAKFAAEPSIAAYLASDKRPVQPNNNHLG